MHSVPPDHPSDGPLDFPPPGPVDEGDPFAQFEGDLEGEATRIEDGDLLAEESTAILAESPGQPLLVVEAGKNVGQEFTLQEGETTLGRGIDNDIILPDVAVSRRHLTIFYRAGVVRLHDPGSGNGTFVNGQRAGTVDLRHGDRIDIGETTLVVKMPGAGPVPAQPRENTDERAVSAAVSSPAAIGPHPTPTGTGYPPVLTPGPHSEQYANPGVRVGGVVIPRAALFAGAGLLAFMIVGFGVLLTILLLRGGGEQRAQVTSQSPSFAAGMRAYESREWDDADRHMRAALAEGDNRASDWIQRTQAARRDQSTLQRANVQLEAGNADAALRDASSISEPSPYHADAQALQQRAQARVVSDAVAQARVALEAGNRARAQALVTRAASLAPENAAVRALQSQLRGGPGAASPAGAGEEGAGEEGAGEEGEGEEGEGEEGEGEEGEEGEEEGGGSTAGGARVRRPTSNPMPRIISAYTEGNFRGAAAQARAAAQRARGSQRTRLNAIAGRIDAFSGLWNRIQRAGRRATRSDLERAISLDRQIARSNHYRNQLTPRLVDAMVAEARRQRNPTQRCPLVRQALSRNSSHSEARQMAAACEREASQLVQRAQASERGNPHQAFQAYQSVLRMVPGSSPLAARARERIRVLTPRVSD